MISFISKVVADIVSSKQDFKDLTLVLPSQRACVFVKNEIIKKISNATILPKIVSIETLMQELSDIRLIDTTQLLFEFYTIYLKEFNQKDYDSFVLFSSWATTVLQDFNEVDANLVNSKDLFENLSDLKRLNNWFQTEEPSKLSKNYIHFFEKLSVLYKKLYTKLKSNKIGYQGLIYREAVENLEYYIQYNSDKRIYFIGFNALNIAEETIFQELLNHKIAKVYWDINTEILNDNIAGTFQLKYKKTWNYYKYNPFNWIQEIEEGQEIEVIETPKKVTQLKHVGEILEETKDFSNSVVVLADENLLPLALNSLPLNVDAINITMGYPLKNIPVSKLFDAIFSLYINEEKLQKEIEKKFYYKDVLRVIDQPYLKKMFPEDTLKLKFEILRNNHIFISEIEIQEYINIENTEGLFSVFTFSENINTILNNFCKLIEKIKENSKGIELEYLYRFYTIFKQLISLNNKYGHLKDLKSLQLFYNRLLNLEKLSFQGEPLQGLQLMGMLETRVLDFDTVIITSVNEGVLPAGKSNNSFIPFDMKKHYKTPTYQDKDVIFSYHFYRLIQRAKKVYLLYNSETDGYGSGEKSRFIAQLELNKKNITHKIVSPRAQRTEPNLLRIEKTEDVIFKLKEVFQNGISPSSLATYIYNPVAFYEQKVLGINEELEIEETVATNTMGSIIHDVLEQLYKPYLNKKLIKEDFKIMFSKIESLLIQFFTKHYKKGEINKGKNKLIYEVCKKYIQRFLKKEELLVSEGNELIIVGLEEKLLVDFDIEQFDFPIKLKGFVDRIDLLNGTLRIIDYKTGKVENSQLKMADFSIIPTDYKYTKALQVMLYTFMYIKATKKSFDNPVEAGIFSFKNLNSGFIKMNFSDKPRGKEYEIKEEIMSGFLNELKSLIAEILNPEIPFIENENKKF